MLDIHNRVHNLRLSTKENFDAIPMVADTILEQSWLLCFDEFQVFLKNILFFYCRYHTFNYRTIMNSC